MVAAGTSIRNPGLLAALALAAAARAPAQDTPVNYTGWYGYEGYHPFHEGKPWGVMLEGYVKRDDVFADKLALFLRVGLNYQVASGHRLTGGYAFQYNYPYDEASEPYDWPDHRIWEQFLLRTPWGPGKRHLLSNRFRLEQRWLGRSDPPDYEGIDDWKFEQTFRYQLRSNFVMSDKIFLVAYDELHLRIVPTDEKLFDQNRIYGGAGFYLDGHRWWRLETGYMLQSVWNSAETAEGRRRTNHTLRVTITSDAPFADR